jgi:hypothetical protein
MEDLDPRSSTDNVHESVLSFEMTPIELVENLTHTLTWKPLGFLRHIKCRTIVSMIRTEIICRHVKLNQWIHRFMTESCKSWVSFLVRRVTESRSTKKLRWLVQNGGDLAIQDYVVFQKHSVRVIKCTILSEGSTHLTYTGLIGGLEHLKIETRLIDERFANVMGVLCVLLPLENLLWAKFRDYVISRVNKMWWVSVWLWNERCPVKVKIYT